MNASSSFLLLLLLAVCTVTFAAAIAAPKAVRDTNGNKVRAGADYFVLPSVQGKGGRLTFGNNMNGSCPFDVVQEQDDIGEGFVLTFSPVNPKKGVIRLSSDLNIKFSVIIICGSTVWKLSDEFYESTKQYFVTSGGVEGNPGPQTVDNWFKIEKVGKVDYKLVFCPTVCNYCKVMCRDIGIYIDEHGVRHLALSDVPLRVMFMKL